MKTPLPDIQPAAFQALRERLAADGVHTLMAQFTDLHGVARGKLVPLNQLELLGGEVIPVLRKELAARRDPESAAAPTHAALVRAHYGDGPVREARPRANRGDNVTGGSPYLDA